MQPKINWCCKVCGVSSVRKLSLASRNVEGGKPGDNIMGNCERVEPRSNFISRWSMIVGVIVVPNTTAKISGFQKQKFRGFRNPDPGFPYLGQSSVHYQPGRT